VGASRRVRERRSQDGGGARTRSEASRMRSRSGPRSPHRPPHPRGLAPGMAGPARIRKAIRECPAIAGPTGCPPTSPGPPLSPQRVPLGTLLRREAPGLFEPVGLAGRGAADHAGCEQVRQAGPGSSPRPAKRITSTSELTTVTLRPWAIASSASAMSARSPAARPAACAGSGGRPRSHGRPPARAPRTSTNSAPWWGHGPAQQIDQVEDGVGRRLLP